MEDNRRERQLSLVSPDRAADYLVIAVSAGISVAAQTEAAGADLLVAGARQPVMRQRFSSGSSLGFPGFLGKSCIHVWIHM